MKTVEVTISGGVVQHVGPPPGVQTIVRDYDVDMSNDDPDYIRHDEHGEPYVREVLQDPNATSIYTVVGLFPDSCWDNGMHDAAFHACIAAETPIDAARTARLQAAEARLLAVDEDNKDERVDEIKEFAEGIVILAVMEGRFEDVYNPDEDKE
jgi:hypothetical protein